MTPVSNCEHSRSLLQSFFEHSTVAIIVVLRNGTIAMCNRAFSQFIGYSEKELLQSNLLDFIFPDDRKNMEAPFRKGGDDPDSGFEYETRLLKKGGSVAWARASGYWISDASRDAYGVIFIKEITADKESEHALRQSEWLYRTVVENTELGFNLIGEDRRILKVNAAAAKLFGKPAESFVGKECFREFEKRDEVCEHCPGTETIATGKPAKIITEGVRDDGSRTVVRLHTFPVTDSDGRARKFVEVVEDITGQMEIRDALRESETRYRLLFEANPLPMWIFDLETLRFLAVNDAAVAHYGYSRDEFLRLTIKDIRPADKIQDLFESLACFKESVAQIMTCHRRKNGSLIDVEIHGHNISFAGRDARIVVAHDVTEKRRAQERVRINAAALMSTRDAVLITDLTPSIISVNPAFAQITGYSESEILGEHPRTLSSSRQDRASFVEIWSALLKEGHWQGEIWGRRKDGETFPGWLTLSTVHDPEGSPSHFVGVITDLTKLRRSEEKLLHLSNHDALTDLPKRHLLESMLEHGLERARREKQRLALLVIDFDQFKTINESFGHKTGDDLLVCVVRRLRDRVRVEDALSRIAGDRFALMLERIKDYSDVDVVTRNLQTALDAPFLLRGGHQVDLRASIGISIYPQDGSTAHDLLCGAEAAVNLAKERGGNQFCYCTSELNAQARKRFEMQSALRQALERKEFILHYQPKVDLRSGRILGAEALLRWDSAERGMIPPLQFIPIAEKSGLIAPIGSWVIAETCRQMRQWRDEGMENFSISLNVSAQQFRTGKLEDQISAALRDYGLDPQCLILELTESMLMDDPEEAIKLMTALRRIGVQISLDDFGTGYSSLEYLGRFPIDQLKIDRSFIKDIVTDPNSAMISTSVIALAHRMRLKVVAEGVETEAQLGYLRQNGCDEMQGFYFSEPVEAEDFAAQFRQGKTLPSAEDTSSAQTLLIVDDDPNIRSALNRSLVAEDFRILTAGSAQEGLVLLAQNTVQVVLTDLRMPEMCGSEFLRRVKALHPDTVRLVLSEFADLPTIMELINEGDLYRLLTKPWDRNLLRRHIRDAFTFYNNKIKPSPAAHC